MPTTLVLGLSATVLAALAAVVLYSNSKSAVNRWLATFTASVTVWLCANMLANLLQHSPVWNLSASRATIVGASLMPITFLMFCIYFTGRRLSFKKRILAAFPVLIMIALAPTGLVITGVNESGDIQTGPAYLGLILLIMTYFAIGIRLLIVDYRQANSLRRQQIYYILAGIVMSAVPAVILSGILPLFGHNEAVSFGPAVVLIFCSFTAVAIVKHRLFDIRLVVARAVGYTGSLGMLALLYGVVIFGLGHFLFNIQASLTAQVIMSLATGVAAFSFQYIRKGFDIITNRLFYQDAYDPTALFDRLNKLLVSTLDMKTLMQKSALIIQESMKIEYAIVGLQAGENDYRLFGSIERSFKDEDVEVVRRSTPHIHTNVIVVDQLSDKNMQLKEVLHSNGVAVLVRLTQNVMKKEEGMGYILLGVKKSGNAYSQKDIRTLQNIANELVIAIQNALHYEEIQNFNLTLQAKVDDATRKLRRTNEKLKALDEAKDDFVSMASHQLRTPLTSIKGYVSMVLEGDAGKINATQHKLLEQSFVSSQRMVFLIADLLNVSRLKTGKFVIEPAPVNLADLVGQEIGQLQASAASRSLELTYQAPQNFPSLMLDETKTRQVIMNFVDNAIYYTPSGGHIKVELVDAPNSIELRVTDDGIGVPKREQPHLFTKFYRAGNARKARPDGTGLGLFMAKKVIMAEGGSIIFETVEGKGSTFGFSIPKTKLANVVAEPKKLNSKTPT